MTSPIPERHPVADIQENKGPRELRPCGTRSAFMRHVAHGEDPCQACTEARSRYDSERKARVRAGLLTPAPKRSLRERLLSKAVINWETGCWEWMASTAGKGYGKIWVGGEIRRSPAHRVAYELIEGPIPEGLQLDHLCRNHGCINPAHLEPVTNWENQLRSPVSPSAQNAAKTHCVNGHEFTAANTIRRSTAEGGNRKCRTCSNAARRRWNARQAAARAAEKGAD